MTKPLKILSASLMLAVASPALAQESALSKSITSGWKSVVKETSKAARSVSKAANDALTPDKPKKRKAAKRKPAANDDTADQQVKPNDGEREQPTNTTATKPAAAPPASRQARDDTDDGPPVPLVVTRENEETAANAKPVLKKQTSPTKRLPPPPPVPAHQQAAPQSGDGDWTASTMDDAPSRAAKLPSAVSLSAEEDSAPSSAPGEKPLPITMIPPKSSEPSVEPNGWPKDEIAAAKANCAAILKAVDAVTIPEAPIREGGCGTPAPVRLVSIGKNPEVALSPPPLVTCDVVAGMHQWMKDHVQPLSKRHFGSPVIKIETMSDYSCRMAYGRKGNKLSEHGRANALDIRGFVTAKGETAYVLEQWGKTARDRAAEAAALAAQKAAAENAARAAAAAGSKTALDAELADANVAAASAESGPPTVRASLAPQLPRPQLARQAEIEKTAAVVVPDAPRTKKALFLHDVHAAACKIFGTSLGPESNEAHRNHFHVDMAERKRTKICE